MPSVSNAGARSPGRRAGPFLPSPGRHVPCGERTRGDRDQPGDPQRGRGVRRRRQGHRLRGDRAEAGREPGLMNAVSIEVATARDANPSGVMFGGWLMQLADRIASVAASRYCGRRVATASVVNMRFVAPCYVGEFLTITAEVISSATTSMTVAALSDSGTPVPISARDTGPIA